MRKPPKVLKTIFLLPTSKGDDLFPNDQRSKRSSAYELEEAGYCATLIHKPCAGPLPRNLFRPWSLIKLSSLSKQDILRRF